MHKEQIISHLKESSVFLAQNNIEILPPGSLPSQETSKLIIDLLSSMYVIHGITNQKTALTKDIEDGKVKTWLAKHNDQFIATASLVQQNDTAWELGRAVSFHKGVGKHLMLQAALSSPGNLVAEVRAAATFEGIVGGETTQHICLDLLDLTPHAIAPLFAHGNPRRNEPFILAAEKIGAKLSITERTSQVLNGRTKKGRIEKVRIIQKEPFQLIVPDTDGQDINETIKETNNFQGCSLFAIESTDQNMPLIGMLASCPQLVVCGVDRQTGPNQKPVIFIATVGHGVLLAKAHITTALPKHIQQDALSIADKFHNLERNI